MPYTLLIASAHQGQRQYLATQLDADGHAVHESDSPSTTVAKLSTHAIDVVLLSGLQRDRLLEALPERRGGTGMRVLKLARERLQTVDRRLVVAELPRPAQPPPDGRPIALGQVIEDVSLLVDLMPTSA